MDPSLSNSTAIDPLNATDRRVRVVYQAQPALPQSALIAFLPVLIGAGAAVLLQTQSVSRTQ